MPDEHACRMAMSPDVLKRLRVGPYSNIPAVLLEATANVCDTAHVKICVWRDAITIEDDGHGMSVGDANNRYLVAGYQRRRWRRADPTRNAVSGKNSGVISKSTIGPFGVCGRP